MTKPKSLVNLVVNKLTQMQVMKRIFTILIVVFTILASQYLLAQTHHYTWMKGAPTTTFAVYGTKGVANTNNSPGSQFGGIPWTDPSGSLWLYGGQGWTNNTNGTLSDLWKYSPATNSWTWVNGFGIAGQAPVYGALGVPAPSNNPGGRNNSASWVDAAGNLWLFGGYVNGSLYNDLWRYTIANDQWTWMGGANTPSQPAVYGSMTVPSTSNIPGASHQFVSWKDPSGNFWLYDPVQGTEIWKYNPSSGQWAWMSGTNTGTVMAVYGTMGVPSSSVHPGERWTSGVGDPSGNLYIFGGKDLTSALFTTRENDLWKYNISTNQWTWISDSQFSNGSGTYGTQGVFSASAIPPGRYGHTLWADNNKLWMYGGEIATLPGYYRFDDTWCFDLTTGQWAWMKGSNTTFQLFQFPATPSSAVYGTLGIPAASNSPGWSAMTTYWTGNPGALWIFPGSEANNSTELWKFSGCVSTSTINISSTAASLCAGSTATLTASGAGTYSWNTGAQTSSIIVSPSITTAYFAMEGGTSNCSIIGGFTLSVQSQSISISSSSNVICSGQTTTLTASGCPTFTWNAGQTGSVLVVSPLATTIYSVSGLSNNCASSASYTQIVNSNPLLNVSSSPFVTCSGNPVILAVSGAVSYSWNNGQTTASFSASPLSTTIYTVTGTTSGCSTTKSFTQQVLPLPNIHVNGPTNAICMGEAAMLIASGANTFTWSLQELTTPVIQVSPILTTTYTATGTDNNGCESATAITVNVLNCTDFREYDGEENYFSIYPNPSSTLFTIRTTEGGILKIVNSLGQIVLEQKLESEAVIIHHRLSPGIYYCTISGISKTLKLLIQD